MQSLNCEQASSSVHHIHVNKHGSVAIATSREGVRVHPESLLVNTLGGGGCLVEAM